MLDRGLPRSFDPAVEREARTGRAGADRRSAAGATCARCRRSRSTRPARATSTTRSRRRAQDDGSWRVWVHIADVVGLRRRRARWSTARPTAAATSVYVPGAVEPMLPRRALQRCLLAGARPGPADGHRRDDGRGGRRSCAARVLPIGDPLRRAARLRAGRPDLRRRRAGRRAVGRAAGGGAGGRRGARRAAGRAVGAVRSTRPSPSSRSTARGNVRRRELGRADRVAPADRAPDDRRQRAGGAAARGAARCRRCTGCTSAPRRPRSSG